MGGWCAFSALVLTLSRMSASDTFANSRDTLVLSAGLFRMWSATCRAPEHQSTRAETTASAQVVELLTLHAERRQGC